MAIGVGGTVRSSATPSAGDEAVRGLRERHGVYRFWVLRTSAITAFSVSGCTFDATSPSSLTKAPTRGQLIDTTRLRGRRLAIIKRLATVEHRDEGDQNDRRTIRDRPVGCGAR